jgi:hypothetical protein
MPAVPKQLADDGIGGTDLLEAKDVHLAGLEPLGHAVPVRSAEAVDVN